MSLAHIRPRYMAREPLSRRSSAECQRIIVFACFLRPATNTSRILRLLYYRPSGIRATETEPEYNWNSQYPTTPGVP